MSYDICSLIIWISFLPAFYSVFVIVVDKNFVAEVMICLVQTCCVHVLCLLNSAVCPGRIACNEMMDVLNITTTLATPFKAPTVHLWHIGIIEACMFSDTL